MESGLQQASSGTSVIVGSPQEPRFDRVRRLVGLVGGPLLALIVFFIPIDALTYEAHALLAVMTLVCAWWITEPIPIPVTSLLGPVLCVVLGVASVSNAFASFASPMIFLFLGGFILAKAMTVHGLDRRFAYGLLSMKWVGSSTFRIFVTVGIAGMLCSGWVSNTATAAMLLPIVIGLLEAIRDMLRANGRDVDLKNYKYATGMMLMCAYAASIGGVLTPIGTPSNVVMMGLLESMAGVTVSFFDWMTWGAVAMVAYMLITVVVLKLLFPADVDHIPGAAQIIAACRRELGPWTRGQINSLVAFCVAVALWIAPGVLGLVFGSDSSILASYNAIMPESVVALVAALLLFFLPVKRGTKDRTLTWRQAVDGVDWGTLILFGGGLSMGSLMYATGLSAWVGDIIVGSLGQAPSQLAVVAAFSVLALVMSELTSNTAATNMVGPLGITVAIAAGLDPAPVAVGIALSASLGFMLPVSTPPNAIVYASGYVPITQMIKTGVIIDVIGIAEVTIPLVVWGVTAVLGV